MRVEANVKAAQALGAGTEGANKEAGHILAGRVIEMMRAADIPNGISALGYTEADIPALTEKAWPQKRVIDNAPVEISKEQLTNLFRDSLSYW